MEAGEKNRVAELIKSLGLPEQGLALDYGCGNGVFTAVLQEALPGWSIQGTDLSVTAIENARQHFPAFEFFTLNEDTLNAMQGQFDFVFSHHVLEHVYDIEIATAEISQLSKPHAYILSIFPCGNPGSLEHKICTLHKNGIDPSRGNRFFFEDEGHLRRLTTVDLNSLLNKHGYELIHDVYANQFFGALAWIGGDRQMIRTLTDHRGVRTERPS